MVPRLFVLTLVLFPLLSLATETPVPTAAYETVALIEVPDIAVPTVVEVPLVTGAQDGDILVEEIGTGALISNLYQANTELAPMPIIQTENAEIVPALSDSDKRTVATFPVTDQGEATVTLFFQFPESYTSSALKLDLARNVSLPSSVRISATDSVSYEAVVVVAPTEVTSERIPFPVTAAESWSVTFSYAQPLRLEEISFIPEPGQFTAEETVRFLAQPNQSYRLFLNPDRAVEVTTREAGNLLQDEGVIRTSLATYGNNSGYIPADVDADGIPDRVDNCVFVANADQQDVDANNRGDACDDFDRDGINNSDDNCPDIPNRTQADDDADGVGNACDDFESRLTEQNPWLVWLSFGFTSLAIIGMFVMVRARQLDAPIKSSEEEDLP